MRRRLIGGRYDLHEQLGASSWHATDTELERDVFVRVPAREVVIARLVHPTIVQVFDLGHDEDDKAPLENGSTFQVRATGARSSPW